MSFSRSRQTSGDRRRLTKPGSAAELRALPQPVVCFSDAMLEEQRPLRAFLRERMYRHYRVNREMSKCKRVVRALFELFMDEPNCLPTQWQADLKATGGDADATVRARLVADYIAGMTDRFALAEYSRLFDMDAKT